MRYPTESESVIMFIEFTTTITHRIEIGDDGIAGISHSVSIDAGEAAVLGTQVIYKIAEAGCKATVNSLNDGKPKKVSVEEIITDEEH